jgi:hypothetical protein
MHVLSLSLVDDLVRMLECGLDARAGVGVKQDAKSA